jgi:catechol 2,3-dioxygenase-like lactoylglutathione lyase family enzyme
VFSHITIGSNDIERSRRFYEPVMATLGVDQPFKLPGTLVFGELAGLKLFVLSPFDQGVASSGNGTHAAFLARDRATVDAFHAAALAHGGTDEGAPGPRPHYHANYYGAYVRDPDGNKLQAVCHRNPDA